MNKVTAKMFSLFDTGGEPENASEDVVIMEFKVHDNEYSLSPQFIHVFFLVATYICLYGFLLSGVMTVKGSDKSVSAE